MPTQILELVGSDVSLLEKLHIKILIGNVGFSLKKLCSNQRPCLQLGSRTPHDLWHSHFFIGLMQVNPSKQMNETPWVAATDEGTVVPVHRNYMAGLQWACSHIEAILFALEVGSSLVQKRCVHTLLLALLLVNILTSNFKMKLCQSFRYKQVSCICGKAKLFYFRVAVLLPFFKFALHFHLLFAMC